MIRSVTHRAQRRRRMSMHVRSERIDLFAQGRFVAEQELFFLQTGIEMGQRERIIL